MTTQTQRPKYLELHDTRVFYDVDSDDIRITALNGSDSRPVKYTVQKDTAMENALREALLLEGIIPTPDEPTIDEDLPANAGVCFHGPKKTALGTTVKSYNQWNKSLKADPGEVVGYDSNVIISNAKKIGVPVIPLGLGKKIDGKNHSFHYAELFNTIKPNIFVASTNRDAAENLAYSIESYMMDSRSTITVSSFHYGSKQSGKNLYTDPFDFLQLLRKIEDSDRNEDGSKKEHLILIRNYNEFVSHFGQSDDDLDARVDKAIRARILDIFSGKGRVNNINAKVTFIFFVNGNYQPTQVGIRDTCSTKIHFVNKNVHINDMKRLFRVTDIEQITTSNKSRAYVQRHDDLQVVQMFDPYIFV